MSISICLASRSRTVPASWRTRSASARYLAEGDWLVSVTFFDAPRRSQPTRLLTANCPAPPSRLGDSSLVSPKRLPLLACAIRDLAVVWRLMYGAACIVRTAVYPPRYRL